MKMQWVRMFQVMQARNSRRGPARRWIPVLGLLLSMTGGLTSCGGNGIVDPLSLFGNGSPPQLEPIVSGLTGGVFTGSAFTNSTPYWVFNAVSFGGLTYIAPADGIVVYVGPINLGGISGNAVTIGHAGRLATRYIGIIPNVRTGDSVVRGQLIGSLTGFSGNQIAFQVLLDGTPVCPLTFLSSNFRSQMTNYFGAAGFLCQ